MSRFLFRVAAYEDADVVEYLWLQAKKRTQDRFWINTTDHPAILSAVLLGDTPSSWWHEPGGGCVYVYSEEERVGVQLFFELHRDYFDRVELEIDVDGPLGSV